MKPASAKQGEQPKTTIVPRVQDGSSSEIKRKKPAFEDLHVTINRRAYELYLQRGCREGHALDDWLEAEREILDREVRN
jgi:hypothetical protein